MKRYAYDATNDKWISEAVSPAALGTARLVASNPARRVTNTSITLASGASAGPGQSTTQRVSDTYVLRLPTSAQRPQLSPPAAGTLRHDILDGLKVICGLMVLACVAMFFLLLA